MVKANGKYNDVFLTCYLLSQDRAFPSTLIEMKKLLSESTRFRQEEVPLRQREKQKLFHHYRELEVRTLATLTFITSLK